ncbi:MAG: RNA 2',3'-cyclic phosphodiesterase [Candidatus Reddybacter sp.]
MDDIDTELRAFIGIPLGGAIQKCLRDSIIPLKAQLNNDIADTRQPAPQIRWVRPENWHITLSFLGQISADQASEIIKLLANTLVITPPFKAELEALSRFPHANGRIIAAVFTNNDAFLELYGQIQEICKIACLHQERRPFKPHITLARIKAPKGHKNESHRPGKQPSHIHIPGFAPIQLNKEITLDRVQLFKSHLSPEGSRYETLAEFLLASHLM